MTDLLSTCGPFVFTQVIGVDMRGASHPIQTGMVTGAASDHSSPAGPSYLLIMSGLDMLA